MLHFILIIFKHTLPVTFKKINNWLIWCIFKKIPLKSNQSFPDQ